MYIFLDAMDESMEKERPEILNLLSDICRFASGCIFKFLVASRPLRHGELDKDFLHIILEEKNRQDIKNTIASGVRDIKAEFPDHFVVDLGFVEDYMMSHANGVFLWVALVLRELNQLVREGFSLADLEHRLSAFPRELEDLYVVIIDRLIKHMGPREDMIEMGRKMLNWATFAERPLAAHEFGDAIIMPSVSRPFEPDAGFLDRARIRGLDRRMKSCCGPLLEISKWNHSNQEVVQLLHLTVREFLLKEDKCAKPFDTDETRGDTEISTCCARYLRLLSLRTGDRELESWSPTEYDEFVEWLAGYPLLGYVTTFLRAHLRSLLPESPVFRELELSLQALWKKDAVFCLFATWAESLGLPRTAGHRPGVESEQFKIRCSVAAAQKGYIEVMSLLTQLHTDLNGVDAKSGHTALTAAARYGRMDAVFLLIKHGARVHMSDGHGETAVLAAARAGHGSLCVYIIDRHGIDVNAKGGEYGNALQAASFIGHANIVKLLLSKGVDINAQGGEYGNALQAAASAGHSDIVRMLLEHGADVNVQGGQYGSALLAASSRGHDGIVQLLLQNGADVNA